MKKISYKVIKDVELDKEVEVSIVLRTRNESEFIQECINRINNQKTSFCYEIIVIDSESEDNTVKLAINNSVRVIEINKSDFNFGTSINLGLDVSKGKYCIFLSAHALPANDCWLDSLVKACKENGVVASYSKQMYDENAEVIEARGLDSKFSDRKKVQSFEKFIEKNNRKPNKFFEYRNDITFSNASSCIKKEVAQKIKFKKIIASEDREWALRVLNEGYKIVYEPKSKVMHYHNEDLEAWYKRIYINAKALNQFSNYEYKKYLSFPIITVNTLRDILFVYKKKKQVNILKQIRTSIKYWRVYCKAFSDATKKRHNSIN